MNNQFNTFVKNGLLICFGTLLVAILVATSYAKSHNLNIDNFFNGNFAYMNGNWYHSQSSNFNSSKNNFNISNLYEENTFDVRENINIYANSETIEFYSEDRDDILVVFEREIIESNGYKVTYKAYETDDTIVVSSKVNSYNLTDLYLEGTIKIFIPNDYICDTLTIESSVGKINNDVLPERLNNLIINADIAEIQLDINQPLNKLNIDNNLGYLSLNIQEPINQIKIKNDSSAIDVSASANIDQMYIQTNAGSVILNLNVSPKTLKIETDLGNVEVDYQNPVGFLEVYSNLGNIEIDVPKNETSTVYKESDLSSFSSDLAIATNKSDANILISIDLGSIEINAEN